MEHSTPSDVASHPFSGSKFRDAFLRYKEEELSKRFTPPVARRRAEEFVRLAIHRSTWWEVKDLSSSFRALWGREPTWHEVEEMLAFEHTPMDATGDSDGWVDPFTVRYEEIVQGFTARHPGHELCVKAAEESEDYETIAIAMREVEAEAEREGVPA